MPGTLIGGGGEKPLPSKIGVTATVAIEAVAIGDEIPVLQVAIDENNVTLFYKATNGVTIQPKSIPIAAMDRGQEVLDTIHGLIDYWHNTDFTDAIAALNPGVMLPDPVTITQIQP
jgi:hypothetical protein